MKYLMSGMVICASLLVLVGCVGNTPRNAIRAADLSGDWVFEVETGSSVTHGAIKLTAQGEAYSGTLTTDQGNNVLPVRSLTLDGAAMAMLVESPNGKVTFAGTLAPDGRTFEGKVTYHNGHAFPMSGSRR